MSEFDFVGEHTYIHACIHSILRRQALNVFFSQPCRPIYCLLHVRSLIDLRFPADRALIRLHSSIRSRNKSN